MDVQKTYQTEFAEAVKENFRKSTTTMSVQSHCHQWFSKCGVQILEVCKAWPGCLQDYFCLPVAPQKEKQCVNIFYTQQNLFLWNYDSQVKWITISKQSYFLLTTFNL